MARTTEPTGDALEFVQRRVGLFGLTAGGLALTFYSFRLVAEVASDEGFYDPSMMYHLAAGLVLVLMWAVLRARQLSFRVIRAVELLGVTLSSALFVWMGMHIPIYSRPDQIVVMALAVVQMSRAVYVPSSGGRTALIAALTGVCIVLTVFVSNLRADLAGFQALAPEVAAMKPSTFATAVTLNAAAWWLLFGTLSVAASRVIYGLRRQVGAIRELGQYHIEAKIGSGGMGVVYRAHHALLRRETAVKLLLPERAGEVALQRFEREVRLTARLKHPNTVTVYDYGRTPDGILYYAMELLEGATLQQIVEATGPFPAERTVAVLLQAAGALTEAHELGLIHRDIKPANIMLCNQGGRVDVVKVLDFGLVKELEGGNQELTQASAITGTPLYMSPEGLKDPASVDARSDLYALGAVAYFLLTGDHVFNGTSLIEVCGKHLHEVPPPPSMRSGRQLPEALDDLVLACLAKDPALRPQTTRELARRLAAIDRGEWSVDQAEAWWQEHGALLKLERVSVSGTAKTIEVDIGRR